MKHCANCGEPVGNAAQVICQKCAAACREQRQDKEEEASSWQREMDVLEHIASGDRNDFTRLAAAQMADAISMMQVPEHMKISTAEDMLLETWARTKVYMAAFETLLEDTSDRELRFLDALADGMELPRPSDGTVHRDADDKIDLRE